ncbi:hypothetical protein MYSTI_04153 [Myxococcus stipitatus DSM 14675]|uniref:Uncharacterized protein n=1 Tax=Myxococcus stipitatus (strain DSM 14675 / JCM 12634 / Mx s8) TaxID=1278073 RepID=L7UBP2_MYXSD|nr:hypothetical protein [Myxococcus stipitatus]AGC45453.1 hypothetical protein MYSTI_04153 [Myxococcus stipitatus DSM 14675]
MTCNNYEMPTAGPPARWVAIKVAAHDASISCRTLNRWADEGLILADRLGSGRGSWLIALNAHGLPISTQPFRAGLSVAPDASGETAP